MKAVVNFEKTQTGKIKVCVKIENDAEEKITTYLLNDNCEKELSWSVVETFNFAQDAKNWAGNRVQEARENYSEIKNKIVPDNYEVCL